MINKIGGGGGGARQAKVGLLASFKNGKVGRGAPPHPFRDGPLFFYLGGYHFGKINCLYTKHQRKKLSAEKVLSKKLFAQHW